MEGNLNDQGRLNQHPISHLLVILQQEAALHHRTVRVHLLQAHRINLARPSYPVKLKNHRYYQVNHRINQVYQAINLVNQPHLLISLASRPNLRTNQAYLLNLPTNQANLLNLRISQVNPISLISLVSQQNRLMNQVNLLNQITSLVNLLFLTIKRLPHISHHNPTTPLHNLKILQVEIFQLLLHNRLLAPMMMIVIRHTSTTSQLTVENR